MANMPVRRKTALGVPIWVIPVLVALVALTAWVVVASADGDDEASGAAGADSTVVSVGPAPESFEPAPPPVPGTSGIVSTAPAGSAVAADPATQAAATQAVATQAAIEAGTAAGAAAGAAAGRAALGSVVDLNRTIRQSASTAGALNGRPVQIAGARVSRVVSDRAFYVGDGADRVLVLMDPTAGGGAAVRVGEQVSVTGSLETYAPGMSESGVAPDAGQSGYVVVTRPSGIAQ